MQSPLKRRRTNTFLFTPRFGVSVCISVNMAFSLWHTTVPVHLGLLSSSLLCGVWAQVLPAMANESTQVEMMWRMRTSVY